MKLVTKLLQTFSHVILLFLNLQRCFCLRWDGNELYDLEGTNGDFIAEANLWTASQLYPGADKYYNCSGVYLLGGYKILGKETGYVRGEYFQRQYQSLPSHNMIIVNMIFYKIDSWDVNQDDYAIFNFDGVTLQTWELATQSYDVLLCGASWRDYPNIKIRMSVPHTASSVTMKVINHLSSNTADESFGFRDINMVFLNIPNPTSSFCGVSSSPLPDRKCPCPFYNEFEQPTGSGTCYSCHADCAICSGPDSNNCLACPVNKYLNHLNQCVDCSAPCATCSGTSSACASCQPPNEYLYPDGTCKSTCNQPYKPNMKDGNKFCEPYCDSTEYFFPPTLGCVTTCPDHYYAEESTNTCKECSDAYCLQCPIDNGQRCTKCQDGTILDELDGSCKVCDSMKITYTRVINNNGHQYKLQLSPSSCILSIQTVVKNLVAQEDTKVQFDPFKIEIQKMSSNIFLMTITFENSVLKQADFGLTLRYLSGTATVPKTIVPSAAIQKLAEYAPAAESLMTSLTSASIGGAFALGAMTVMWPLVNFQQFIGYFVYVNVNYPLQVELFFSLFSFANFNFLPNPLASLTDGLSEGILLSKDIDLLQTYQAPIKFRKKEETSFFVENGASNFLMNIGLLVVLALTGVIVRFCRMRVPLARATYSTLKWNFIIRAFLENGIPLTLATLLQLKRLSFNNAYTIICGILAILAFIYILMMMQFLRETMFRINSEVYKMKYITQQYGTLYDGITIQNGLAKYYHLFILLRGILLIFLIVFIEKYPILQTIPLIIVNLSLVYFLFKHDLFENTLQNIINKIREILITVAEVCIMLMSFDVNSESYPQVLGWMIIAALGVAMLTELTFIIINQAKAIKVQFRKTKALTQLFLFGKYEKWKSSKLKVKRGPCLQT